MPLGPQCATPQQSSDLKGHFISPATRATNESNGAALTLLPFRAASATATSINLGGQRKKATFLAPLLLQPQQSC
ncbi:protein of unknown function [Nitratireductor aquimarinus]